MILHTRLSFTSAPINDIDENMTNIMSKTGEVVKKKKSKNRKGKGTHVCFYKK